MCCFCLTILAKNALKWTVKTTIKIVASRCNCFRRTVPLTIFPFTKKRNKRRLFPTYPIQKKRNTLIVLTNCRSKSIEKSKDDAMGNLIYLEQANTERVSRHLWSNRYLNKMTNPSFLSLTTTRSTSRWFPRCFKRKKCRACAHTVVWRLLNSSKWESILWQRSKRLFSRSFWWTTACLKWTV